jgi:hypothetical protein
MQLHKTHKHTHIHTHTHTHTKEGPSEKEFTWDIIYLTLNQPWKIPHISLVWGQASIIASIRFQRRSWSKIMEGINLKAISEMALVMVWELQTTHEPESSSRCEKCFSSGRDYEVNPSSFLLLFFFSSSVAPLSNKDKNLPSYFSPSIPILLYFSPTNNSHFLMSFSTPSFDLEYMIIEEM